MGFSKIGSLLFRFSRRKTVGLETKELTIIKDGSLYLPMPEREGYDFTGWYLDDSLTQFAGAYHDTYRITRDTDF